MVKRGLKPKRTFGQQYTWESQQTDLVKDFGVPNPVRKSKRKSKNG